MSRFIVEKIADYWRVLRVTSNGGRKIVSTHSTRKDAKRARRRAESAQPSPQQVYRDLVEGTFVEAGREC